MGGLLDSNFEGDQSGRGPGFFDPIKETIFYVKYIIIYFFACNLKRDLHGYIWAKYHGVFPWTSQVRPKSEIYTSK